MFNDLSCVIRDALDRLAVQGGETVCLDLGEVTVEVVRSSPHMTWSVLRDEQVVSQGRAPDFARARDDAAREAVRAVGTESIFAACSV